MIILITGKLGSGKSKMASELCSAIKNSCLIKFADPLYAIHSSVQETLRGYGRNLQGINRDLLQDIGIWGRKQEEDFWVKIAKDRIGRILLENPNAVAIVDDGRFPNELNAFPNAFKIRLVASEECRVKRAQKLGNLNHISETALDHLPNDCFSLVLDTENDSIEENVAKCLSALRVYSPSI